MTTKPPRGVPRDEWLLAVALANYRSGAFSDYCALDNEPGDWAGLGDGYGSDASAFANGTWHRSSQLGDEGNPDAYAAGAALAMALESE